MDIILRPSHLLTRFASRQSKQQTFPFEGCSSCPSADANLVAIKEKAKQYDVTQHAGTERPFQNEYCDNNPDRIYVDVVTGEPLFSSRDMYSSGTCVH